ncbi:MAG: hypothetical protein CL946_03715 [Ectothiorhodospiraceae bacterium]|nr:hypothetical protein [Ectothiorhodospiraceae bacterium]
MNSTTDTEPLKLRVRDHWEDETCGVRTGESAQDAEYYAQIREHRYSREHWILPFQNAPAYKGKRVLEIGIGAGSDFLQWVKADAKAVGIDLTHAAMDHARRQIATAGYSNSIPPMCTADAERLPFRNSHFDLIYSYGVLHHSPDTAKTIREAYRVLAPGGELKIMIYHHPCWTGFLLWLLHYAAKGRFHVSQRQAMYEHLESPGTKSYTVEEGKSLLRDAGFADVNAELNLGHGDLLTLKPSAKYDTPIFRILRTLYPRWLVRLLGNRFGIVLLLHGRKPETA